MTIEQKNLIQNAITWKCLIADRNAAIKYQLSRGGKRGVAESLKKQSEAIGYLHDTLALLDSLST